MLQINDNTWFEFRLSTKNCWENTTILLHTNNGLMQRDEVSLYLFFLFVKSGNAEQFVRNTLFLIYLKNWISWSISYYLISGFCHLHPLISTSTPCRWPKDSLLLDKRHISKLHLVLDSLKRNKFLRDSRIALMNPHVLYIQIP